MKFPVTERAARPVGRPDQCFYCGMPVGSSHMDNCVLIKKRVKVRAVIEYEVDVPRDWGREQVEFHRNEGTWCSDNIVGELEELTGTIDGEQECLCGSIKFEYLGDVPNSVECEG